VIRVSDELKKRVRGRPFYLPLPRLTSAKLGYILLAAADETTQMTNEKNILHSTAAAKS
jgi:hypothetical protein